MSTESLLKAKQVISHFGLEDSTPKNLKDDSQYNIKLREGNREIIIRIAPSKDKGEITGIDHTDHIVFTLVTNSQTSIMYVNGERNDEWIGRLEKRVNQMFSDPVNFEK